VCPWKELEYKIMKNPSEWDEDYVLNLPPGEHDWIEFKSAEKLDFSLPSVDRNAVRSEMSKQLSAFANTGGGTIIYGIEDTAAGGTRRVDKHGGVSLKLTKNGIKDWLEDVIPTLVDLPLARFNIYTIIRAEATSSIADDKAIILIDVPSSEGAPHQANDNKYYARIAGRSRPIGHRLVLDIMGRAKHPKMSMEFSFSPRNDTYRLKTVLNCYCRNIGRMYANYVNVFISVPSDMIDSYRGDGTVVEINGRDYMRFYIENIRKDYVGSSNSNISVPYYVTRYDPVLPQLRFRKGIDIDIDLESDGLSMPSEEWVYWTIYADNAAPENGKTKVAEIKIEEDRNS
jgi:Schlafen, AlbA_2